MVVEVNVSKFYGTVTSDKGERTRTGHKFIRATAQSFEGSVGVEIRPTASGGLFVTLLIGKGSTPAPSFEVLTIGLGELQRLAGMGAELAVRMPQGARSA